MSDNTKALDEKREYTKEELQEYKEKLLVVLQDAFGSVVLALVNPMEFMNMIPMFLSMLHAIYDEGGEHTWKCDDDHTELFEKLDVFYKASMKDRAENNDVVSWVDDPEKQAILEKMHEKMFEKYMNMMDDKKDTGDPGVDFTSGHLH